MNIDIVRNNNTTTKLTVNKSRITIKLKPEDHDNQDVVDFLINVGETILGDPRISVTMRGRMDRNGISMFNDAKTFSVNFTHAELRMPDVTKPQRDAAKALAGELKQARKEQRESLKEIRRELGYSRIGRNNV